MEVTDQEDSALVDLEDKDMDLVATAAKDMAPEVTVKGMVLESVGVTRGESVRLDSLVETV